MKMSSTDLIADLTGRTKQVIREAQELKTRSLKELNAKDSPESWSALECIEHLNLYGDFYLPEVEMRIRESGYAPQKIFTSRLLGDYFAESMLPKGKMRKMKTFRDKNPLGSRLDKEVLTKFIEQQHKLLELLKESEEVSLNRTRTSISISRWLKLKLGDTLRILVYHNQRHMKQAKRALRAVEVKH